MRIEGVRSDWASEPLGRVCGGGFMGISVSVCYLKKMDWGMWESIN